MGEVRWTQAAPRLRIVVTRATTTAGARPPILMLHGLWHAAWAWQNWSDLLAARGYDCHAVDLRGHGGSEGDIRTARLRDYLQDARRIAAALPHAPILIGHSLGGALVEHLLAAGTYPAAVLVAGVPGRYPVGTIIRTATRRPVKTLQATLRRDLAALVDTPRAARRLLFSPNTPHHTVQQAQRSLTTATPRLIRELISTPPARPTRMTPTLILAPTGDAVFSPRKQRRRARAIGADYLEIADSGHDIPLDHRWQHAADATTTWLTSQNRLPLTRREHTAFTGAPPASVDHIID